MGPLHWPNANSYPKQPSIENILLLRFHHLLSSLLTRSSPTHPTESLTRSNMNLDMSSMAAAMGLSVAVLRFLLCFVATIPISLLWRLVPRTLPKHIYSAFTGVLLCCISFGISSNLHFLVSILIGYSSMLVYRPKCGLIAFFAAFGYLIGW